MVELPVRVVQQNTVAVHTRNELRLKELADKAKTALEPLTQHLYCTPHNCVYIFILYYVYTSNTVRLPAYVCNARVNDQRKL